MTAKNAWNFIRLRVGHEEVGENVGGISDNHAAISKAQFVCMRLWRTGLSQQEKAGLVFKYYVYEFQSFVSLR